MAVILNRWYTPRAGTSPTTGSIEPDTDKRLLRLLFERYLGGTDNDLGDFLLDPDREEVRIHIAPERLYTWDFSDRMDDTRAGDAGPAGERAGGDRPGG